MRLARKHMILLVVGLAIISSSLFAATLDASYSENLDTIIHNSSDYGIQNQGFPVALHVGTMTIRSRGGGVAPAMYGIRMDRSGDFGDGEEYWLESTQKINNQKKFGAQLIAKTMFAGNTIVRTINWGTGEDPLMEERDFFLRQYPITIEFYLGIRNIFSVDQAVGVGFQFKHKLKPNLGNFRVMYRPNPWWGTYYTIPIEGSSAHQPFFTIDYGEDSSNYLNGQLFDPTVYVSLSIEQTAMEKSINLHNTSGQDRSKVGQVRLTLTGYKKPSSQGVSITFTDGNGSPDSNFHLNHNQVPSFIPFSLYLAGEKVDNKVPIIWPNLVYGESNLKVLEVGDIDHKKAISKMGGAYSDTIYVNITPLDTNLVGK